MLRFAAVGIDHGHIFGHVDGLKDAGAEFVGYCPKTSLPALVENFQQDLSGCSGARSRRHLRRSGHRRHLHRGHPARPRRPCRAGDERRQGRDGRTSPASRPATSLPRCAPPSPKPAASSRSAFPSATPCRRRSRPGMSSPAARSARCSRRSGSGRTSKRTVRPDWFWDPVALWRHHRRHRLAPDRPVPPLHRLDERRGGGGADRQFRHARAPGVPGLRRPAAALRQRRRLYPGRLVHAAGARRPGATGG